MAIVSIRNYRKNILTKLEYMLQHNGGKLSGGGVGLLQGKMKARKGVLGLIHGDSTFLCIGYNALEAERLIFKNNFRPWVQKDKSKKSEK